MSDETTGTSLEQAMIDNVQDQAAEAAEAAESSEAQTSGEPQDAPQDAEEAQEELSPEEKEAAEKEAATKAAEAALGGSADDAEGADEEASESAEAGAAAAAEAEYKTRLRAFTRELKKQPGQWYIIQCYSGYENKVKTNLDMRAQTLEVEDSIFEVVVPVEQILEKKDGKKKVVKRKLLPGYVLVRMELNDAAWSVVRDTPGVTSFVGNEGNATPGEDPRRGKVPHAERRHRDPGELGCRFRRRAGRGHAGEGGRQGLRSRLRGRRGRHHPLRPAGLRLRHHLRD